MPRPEMAVETASISRAGATERLRWPTIAAVASGRRLTLERHTDRLVFTFKF
jgi:hypothetical protein